jgi:hypothetical protein
MEFRGAAVEDFCSAPSGKTAHHRATDAALLRGRRERAGRSTGAVLDRERAKALYAALMHLDALDSLRWTISSSTVRRLGQAKRDPTPHHRHGAAGPSALRLCHAGILR